MLKRFDRTRPGAVGIGSIVVHELYFGAYNSQKVAHNLETIRLLLADLVTVEFDAQDACAAGEIRAGLGKRGTPIGPLDVLIAGQATQRDVALVTNNVGGFRRVEGLRTEDWSVPDP